MLLISVVNSHVISGMMSSWHFELILYHSVRVLFAIMTGSLDVIPHITVFRCSPASLINSP